MRKPRKEEGGSWMDTYGDMVTLLLCFFVLLYAMSAIDQTKWNNLVKSLNPDVTEALESEIDANKNEEDEMQDVIVPANFQALVENLRKEVEERNMADQIEVKSGDGFIFITFKSNIIFDANSYILKDEAKVLLDSFCDIMSGYTDEIEQIQVLGHTAEVSKGQVNIVNDRFLSSNRAAAVLVYMQEKNIFDPVTLVSMGYGQYRPIADNSTPEGRAENRRVEILITKSDTVARSLDEYYKEAY